MENTKLLIREYSSRITSTTKKKGKCDFNAEISLQDIEHLYSVFNPELSALATLIKEDFSVGIKQLEELIDYFDERFELMEKVCFAYHVPYSEFDTPLYMHDYSELISEMLKLLYKTCRPLAYRKKVLYRRYCPSYFIKMRGKEDFWLDFIYSNHRYEQYKKELISKAEYKIKVELMTVQKAAKEVIKEEFGGVINKFAESLRTEIRRKVSEYSKIEKKKKGN